MIQARRAEWSFFFACMGFLPNGTFLSSACSRIQLGSSLSLSLSLMIPNEDECRE